MIDFKKFLDNSLKTFISNCRKVPEFLPFCVQYTKIVKSKRTKDIALIIYNNVKDIDVINDNIDHIDIFGIKFSEIKEHKVLVRQALSVLIYSIGIFEKDKGIRFLEEYKVKFPKEKKEEVELDPVVDKLFGECNTLKRVLKEVYPRIKLHIPDDINIPMIMERVKSDPGSLMKDKTLKMHKIIPIVKERIMTMGKDEQKQIKKEIEMLSKKFSVMGNSLTSLI